MPRRCSLDALDGVTDPETKRKVIGGRFIDVFEEEAARIGGADFLAQGTLYPDVIESVSVTGGPSVTIKSHHNVGGLPRRMRMQLVSRCASCSRTRCRKLGRSWVCLTRSSAVTRFLVRAWPSVSRAQSPAPDLGDAAAC